MAFQSLHQLITDSSEIAALMSSLAKCVEDNGGGVNHLNRLLEDAKVERALLTQFVRRAIGPIWDLTENPFDLATIDYNKPLRKFLQEFNGTAVDIHENVSSIPWTEPSKPKEGCRYQLVHPEGSMSRAEILAAPVKHAGIRELAMFAAASIPEQLSGCTVIAAGSQTEGPNGHFASASAGFGKIYIGWKGFKRPETERFDKCNFYLARV